MLSRHYVLQLFLHQETSRTEYCAVQYSIMVIACQNWIVAWVFHPTLLFITMNTLAQENPNDFILLIRNRESANQIGTATMDAFSVTSTSGCRRTAVIFQPALLKSWSNCRIVRSWALKRVIICHDNIKSLRRTLSKEKTNVQRCQPGRANRSQRPNWRAGGWALLNSPHR